MKKRVFHFLLPALCLPALLLFSGCANLHPGAKVALTPLTVARDVVDLPLVTITNVFEYFAQSTRPARSPHAGVGWNWRGGLNFGIGYDISHFLFKGISYVLGAGDYLVGRSVWPNFPVGVSPWISEKQGWGDLYFPSTRALWRKSDTP